jgi:hypothetical protein
MKQPSTNTDVNAQFGVGASAEAPASVAGIDLAAIRAKAAEAVAAEEATLLEQFTAEARAKGTTDAKLKARAQAAVAQEAEKITLDHNGIPEEYTWVTLQPGNNKKDLSYVPIGVNGHIMQVTRGKKVPLPNAYVHVLENAVTEITESSMNEFVTRPAQRFNYTSHGPCSKDEYQAFRAANTGATKHLS